MEHLYTVHTKTIQNKTYYFVKKILKLTEFRDLADVVIGYGMHTDFEKACSIAGINDEASREQLLADLQQQKQPKRETEKVSVEISEMINKWLAETGATVLN